jgi:hypothetical protein
LKDSTKRWPNLLVAGLLAAVVTGVVYTAVSLPSLLTCDAGSNCFLATFLAGAPGPVDTGTTLTSAVPPPAQPPPAQPPPAQPSASFASQENPPILPPSSAPKEAPIFTPAVPRITAAADAAPPLVAEPKKEDATQISAVANETPAIATLPESPAPVAGPPIAPPAGPTEPEPGVLTDPPAGVVFDENAVPNGPPPGNPPEPPMIVPIVIFPPSGRALRVH